VAISIIDKELLKVSPLTVSEKAWLKKLDDVLNSCPDRLELCATGDAMLSVVDKEGARSSELCDGAALDDGVLLADVSGSVTIHGISA
jgi:hypothetical protein